MGKSESTADKAIAARMVREAAERARRAEIMSKINELEKEKAECVSLKAGFLGEKGKVGEMIAQMNSLKSMHLQPDGNCFSGITANALGLGILAAQTSMGKSCNYFSNIESAIGSQIEKLNAYIMELENKISSLKASI